MAFLVTDSTLYAMYKVVFFAAFHEVSVYPKKELPFFILFTAGLCSFTALLALLTHQYPEPMGIIARSVIIFKLFYFFMFLYKYTKLIKIKYWLKFR